MTEQRLTIDLLPDASEALHGAYLAQFYHGGQFTALYALASSGSLELCTGDGLGRLIRELRQAIEIAEAELSWDDVESLGHLLKWCVMYDRRMS